MSSQMKLASLLLRHPLVGLKGAVAAVRERQAEGALRSAYGRGQLPTVDVLDLMPDFGGELSAYSFLEGTSLPTDMLLLKRLAQRFAACNYLEIGSWRGESLANVAAVAQRCTSITLSPAEMRRLGIGEQFIEVHGAFSHDLVNVTEILHNSRTFDFTTLAPDFDLIFIDGDHSYEGVLNDTRKTFGLRRDQSSVIVWHDYGFAPETVRPTVLKAILDGVPSDKHANLFHVSNTMCAIYMEEHRFDTCLTAFPTYPNKNFVVNIQAEPLRAKPAGSAGRATAS